LIVLLAASVVERKRVRVWCPSRKCNRLNPRIVAKTCCFQMRSFSSDDLRVMGVVKVLGVMEEAEEESVLSNETVI